MGNLPLYQAGPKGIGALCVRSARPRVRLPAEMGGGGHEAERRSGTHNMPAIVGFAKACELLVAEGAAETKRIAALRDRLQKHRSGIDGLDMQG